MANAEFQDGQTASGKGEATDTRLLGRSCESLWGICAGIMADKKLSDEEIRFLHEWLDKNKEIAATWPGEVVYARVRDVLADGVITEDERRHLEETLAGLINGTLAKAPAPPEVQETLPDEDEVSIEIPGRSFCFTGAFFFGTQSACERAVSRRGGLTMPGVKPGLNYLVIGSMASEVWADTEFSSNIERAMRYQGQGHDIVILGEELWMRGMLPEGV